MSQVDDMPESSAGKETLTAFSKASAFNKWMGSQIMPWLLGDILEIGSGIGNLSDVFLKNNLRLTLSDYHQDYFNILRDSFSHLKNCAGVERIDLSKALTETDNDHLIEKFDSLVALNVVEHIEDDFFALSNCAHLLKPGGRCVILVPAFSFLYNSFDRELGHYRRYTRKTLSGKMTAAGFDIIGSQYFNMAGMIGWYFSGSVLKNKLIPEGQLDFYNRLVPVFRAMDKVFCNSIGLSVIVVGAKRAS